MINTNNGEYAVSDINDILRLANLLPQEEELLEMSDSFDLELTDDYIIESGVVGFADDGVIIEGDDNVLKLLSEHGATLEDTDIIVESVENSHLSDILSILKLINEAEFQPGNVPQSQGSGPSFQPGNTPKVRDSKDFWERRKTLQKLLLDPNTSKDPSLKKEVLRMWDALNSQAAEVGVALPEGDDMHIPKQSEEDMTEAEYQGRKVPLNKPMAGDVKKSKVYVKKPNGKVVKVNFGDKNMRIKKSNPNRRKSFRARHRCENPGPKWKARYWSCRAW